MPTAIYGNVRTAGCHRGRWLVYKVSAGQERGVDFAEKWTFTYELEL